MTYRYDRTGERVEVEQDEPTRSDAPREPEPAARATPAPAAVEQLRCPRCRYLLLPEEAADGHRCRRPGDYRRGHATAKAALHQARQQMRTDERRTFDAGSLRPARAR